LSKSNTKLLDIYRSLHFALIQVVLLSFSVCALLQLYICLLSIARNWLASCVTEDAQWCTSRCLQLNAD